MHCHSTISMIRVHELSRKKICLQTTQFPDRHSYDRIVENKRYAPVQYNIKPSEDNAENVPGNLI